MRSEIVATLVGGMFLLVGAPMALAKPAAMPAKPAIQHFQGAVSQLDPAAKTLAVQDHAKTDGKVMTFALAADAKILQGKTTRSLPDLKVGERVRVTYTDHGAAHQAKRIELLPAKTAMAKPTQPKAAGTQASPSKPQTKASY